jgi:two-component system, OmpR family, sensor kinase
MWKPRSLVQRVVLSVALGSLLAGAIVAVITVVLANHLASEQEDKHLRAAARTLAVELLVKGYDPFYAAAEEAHELANTGIVVALFQAGSYLAGNTALPLIAPGACESTTSLRVCAVPAGRWVSLAGRDPARLSAHADETLRAAGIALLATMLLSTALALVLAFTAVKPLDRLTQALRKLPIHEPSQEADLGPASGVDEVDTLRVSLLSAFAALRQALDRSRSFTGNAAHQLRTPLATLMGELDLAIEAVDGATRDDCVRAHHEAKRLSMLIDRLLILANPDDTLRASTTVSLSDLIEDARDALPEEARARIDVDTQSVSLEADPTLIHTAIVAALERALEHHTGRVHVHTQLHAGNARLAIQAGPTTTNSPDDDGICIAVVERVVTLHGGQLDLDPTQLSLTLPLQR